MPQRGVGYGILRYLCKDNEINSQLKNIPSPEISFNYLGQFDQVQSESIWKFAPESAGENRSPEQNREHKLDINCLVVEGELQINWAYSNQIHHQKTVADLAQSYLENIRVLTAHCQLEDSYGYTPSDFPKIDLKQSELDKLIVPIGAQNIESIYPLSPMQQGMLFHSLYAPDGGVYVEQTSVRLIGDIQHSTFKSAWQQVVERYSTFRTLFIWENLSTPLQVVLKQVNLPWTHLNWQSLSLSEQEQRLSELLAIEREQGFQLNQAPPTQFTLIQLSDDTYQFIWSHHHVLLDGWCLPIIFKELLSLYEAEVKGKTCFLSAPTPYERYIDWLQAQDPVAATEFWQGALDGFNAPTPLVVERTRSKAQQQKSEYHAIVEKQILSLG